MSKFLLRFYFVLFLLLFTLYHGNLDIFQTLEIPLANAQYGYGSPSLLATPHCSATPPYIHISWQDQRGNNVKLFKSVNGGSYAVIYSGGNNNNSPHSYNDSSVTAGTGQNYTYKLEFYRSNGNLQTGPFLRSISDFCPPTATPTPTPTPTPVPRYTITGVVFVDSNFDGIHDVSESGYQNQTVSLSGAATSSSVTGSNGQYTLPNLLAGTYTVSIIVPAGYQAMTATSVIKTLGPNTTVDFGIAQKNNTIAGNIFVDLNYDGTKNNSETNFTASSATIAITGPLSTPVSATTQITTGTGVYTSGNLYPGTYTVAYTNVPNGYAMTNPPPNISPPTFTVVIGSGCDTANTNGAVCNGAGSMSNLNFGMNNNNVWWQTIGGSVLQANTINNPIPAGASCQSYASLTDPANTSPGFIFSGGTPDFGSGQASVPNWQVSPYTYSPENPGVVRTSYSYLTTSVRSSGITTTDLTTICALTGTSLNNCQLPAANFPSGIYTADQNVTINNASPYTFPNAKNYIFLIDGDLTINNTLLVDIGGTATFSTSGNIHIASTVGEASANSVCDSRSHTGCDLEGFYSTDQSFILEGAGQAACGTGSNDNRFNLAGAIVVNAALQGGTLQNNRSLCAGNLSCPAYSIVQRPDLILNTPDFLKYQNYVWQEIVP